MLTCMLPSTLSIATLFPDTVTSTIRNRGWGLYVFGKNHLGKVGVWGGLCVTMGHMQRP